MCPPQNAGILGWRHARLQQNSALTEQVPKKAVQQDCILTRATSDLQITLTAAKALCTEQPARTGQETTGILCVLPSRPCVVGAAEPQFPAAGEPSAPRDGCGSRGCSEL